MSRYRLVGDGLAVRPVLWAGFNLYRLRRCVVERTGVFTGEPLGLPSLAGPPGSPM